jgi:hypothetical protein
MEQNEIPAKRKKSKSSKERDRNKEYQRERYADNRDEVLAGKKERYDTDPEYRQRIQEGSQRAYWLKRRQQRERKLPSIEVAELQPSARIQLVVDNPADVRHMQPVEVSIYTTTQVSKLLGRTPETMRVWLNDGVLPEPAYRGADMPEVPVKGFNPRLFTEDEMRVIADSREKLLLPDHGRKHALFTTAVAEGFESLRQGLVLVPAA